MIRRAIPFITTALLLAACQREPDFDERYAATQKKLEAKAAEIDRQMATPAPSPSAT